MHANYDAVAGYYDRLSQLVFGNALYKAQVYLIKAIPAEARVLIVGGGTGWILEEIAQIHGQGLQITYVEISERMLGRSKKRNAGNNKVTFISSAIQEAILEKEYDVVITPFLLDNFSDSMHKQVFRKIDNHCRRGGLWLCADFQIRENSLKQRLLLKTMYLFFGFLCNLDTASLPDSAMLFHLHNYRAVSQEQFYNGFVSSVIYQKK